MRWLNVQFSIGFDLIKSKNCLWNCMWHFSFSFFAGTFSLRLTATLFSASQPVFHYVLILLWLTFGSHLLPTKPYVSVVVAIAMVTLIRAPSLALAWTQCLAKWMYFLLIRSESPLEQVACDFLYSCQWLHSHWWVKSLNQLSILLLRAWQWVHVSLSLSGCFSLFLCGKYIKFAVKAPVKSHWVWGCKVSGIQMTG